MGEPSFNPAELTREKNLADIWRQARKIRDSKFNDGCTIAIGVLLGLYTLLTPEQTPVLADKVRNLCDLGLNTAVAVLGFLIAGFTILATLSKPDLFLAMAKIPYKKSGLSTLKYNLFVFMKVFAVFLFFIMVCLLIKLFASSGGPLSVFLSYIPGNDGIKAVLARIGFVSISTLFVYLVVLLQSFIFNVYNIVMTGLRWEAEKTDPGKP